MSLANDAWRTSVDSETCARYGVSELHAVFLQPVDDIGGTRNCVIVNIPETPTPLIKEAISNARRMKARVGFVCDTRKQADAIAERVDAGFQNTGVSRLNGRNSAHGARQPDLNGIDHPMAITPGWTSPLE
jgi:hypothetical protein